MSYPLLFQAVYCEPLCVDVSTFLSIHAVLWPRITQGKDLTLPGMQAAAGSNNDKRHKNALGRRATYLYPTVKQGQVVSDELFYRLQDKPETAVIPIYGILAKNAGWVEEMCMGVTDINPAMTAVQQATKAKDVKTIVLDISSPGGQVTGIRELASAVRAATEVRGKTVYTFSDAQIASAAYWIGSQADEVYVTPSSTPGSIGTYLAWLDETVKMKMQGLELQFFGAGKYKGVGLPGKALSDEDKAMLQAKVNEINGWFTSSVLAARPKVADSTMQGQTFTGEQAVKLHLADGLVGSWEEFVDLI